MNTYRSIGRYSVRENTVFAVALGEDVTDFDHLVGHDVEIDGETYRCIAVERFAHMPPWRKGEKIGIMVEENSGFPIVGLVSLCVILYVFAYFATEIFYAIS